MARQVFGISRHSQGRWPFCRGWYWAALSMAVWAGSGCEQGYQVPKCVRISYGEWQTSIGRDSLLYAPFPTFVELDSVPLPSGLDYGEFRLRRLGRAGEANAVPSPPLDDLHAAGDLPAAWASNGDSLKLVFPKGWSSFLMIHLSRHGRSWRGYAEVLIDQAGTVRPRRSVWADEVDCETIPR